jgi:pimeloyl-ACP methyl ester carboxylesterase
MFVLVDPCDAPLGRLDRQARSVSLIHRVGQWNIANIYRCQTQLSSKAHREGIKRAPSISMSTSICWHALQDIQREIRVARSRATEWSIDPERLGVMGFSVGGELAALAAVRYDAGVAAWDAVERQSSKPLFQALIYPAIPRDMPQKRRRRPFWSTARMTGRTFRRVCRSFTSPSNGPAHPRSCMCMPVSGTALNVRDSNRGAVSGTVKLSANHTRTVRARERETTS